MLKLKGWRYIFLIPILDKEPKTKKYKQTKTVLHEKYNMENNTRR